MRFESYSRNERADVTLARGGGGDVGPAVAVARAAPFGPGTYYTLSCSRLYPLLPESLRKLAPPVTQRRFATIDPLPLGDEASA
jgi:hypothetical protein